jgi:hypothetical protein
MTDSQKPAKKITLPKPEVCTLREMMKRETSNNTMQLTARPVISAAAFGKKEGVCRKTPVYQSVSGLVALGLNTEIELEVHSRKGLTTVVYSSLFIAIRELKGTDMYSLTVRSKLTEKIGWKGYITLEVDHPSGKNVKFNHEMTPEIEYVRTYLVRADYLFKIVHQSVDDPSVFVNISYNQTLGILNSDVISNPLTHYQSRLLEVGNRKPYSHVIRTKQFVFVQLGNGSTYWARDHRHAEELRRESNKTITSDQRMKIDQLINRFKRIPGSLNPSFFATYSDLINNVSTN